ncbi:hypothetical protein HDV00_000773 [Rhizophlyctis rosea]|nr:hypothetical protein HDV00_000773 [Rhizophlyctis rosea]
MTTDLNLTCMISLVRDAIAFLHETGGISVKAGMNAYLDSVRQELTLLNSPMSLTVCVIGGVQTESFQKGMGEIARQQGGIFLSDAMIKSAAKPEAAGEFLVSAAGRRVKYAYGPDYIAAAIGELFYYIPSFSGWFARKLPTISGEFYQKIRTGITERRRELSE